MSGGFRISLSKILTPLIAGVVVIAVCGGLYWQETGSVEQNLRDRETRRAEIFTRLIGRDLQSAIQDLKILADGDGLQAYLLSGKQTDLDRAIRRATFFSRQESAYDQLRYLDEQGREVLRVNANGTVVSPGQLQNKADRPYFKKAHLLAPGQIFISSFDLNVEHGEVEKPIKPMIRLAIPVFDVNGKRRGVYVINYLGSRLLADLQEFLPQYSYRLRILNAGGYWLKGATPDEEWGFMFPDRIGQTMNRTDPDFWSQVTSSAQGQVHHRGGLFTWRRITMREALPHDPDVMAEDDFLVLGSEISDKEWSTLFAPFRQTFLGLFLMLLLLMALSWRFFHLRQRAEQEKERFFVLTRDVLCIAGFDGYFKRVNPSWERTFGYTSEELLSQPFLEFVHPDDRQQTAAEAEALARGEETVDFENRYRCKDGSYRWLTWSARSLPGEKLIYASGRDLTDRRRAEEEVLKLNEELKQHADQLEVSNKELEAFSYSVSHDLRAPLRHMDGFVEMLSKRAAEKLDDRERRYLGIISDSAKQMGTLIDDLLLFSRMNRTEFHYGTVDSNAMVHEVLDSMFLDIKGRRITWKISPLPEVRADPAMLRQVWVNLIANAIKYTRPRNPAEIEIGYSDGPETDEWTFFIRDNGVGFDMQYADKLFGVFQRLHRSEEFEGTGIGLANVRRIVSRHGGRTWADSKIDQGSTFFFTLKKKPTSLKG